MAGVNTTAVPGASGVAVAAGTVNGVKTTQTFFGYSLRETAGAVASWRIREKDATGRILAVGGLVANGSDNEWLGPQGEFVKDDIYFEKIAGTIEGVIRHG